MKTARRDRLDLRPLAVMLVFGSGVVLLIMGMVLQVGMWELRSYASTEYGSELPGLTRFVLESFGVRSTKYVPAVAIWLWWPMVASLVYCMAKYRRPLEFAAAFIYWLSLCWLAVMFVVSFVAVTISMMWIYLCSDLVGPPWYMQAVSPISWAMLVAVVVFGIYCLWRYRLSGKAKRGNGKVQQA